MSGQVLHASCVAVDGKGLLILGPSGSGKSSLALRLIALGAVLVADDRTEVTPGPGGLIARCPPALRGLIEARGMGILNAPHLAEAPITLAVDLKATETDRLPPQRSIVIAGSAIDLVHGQQSDHFPAAILCYLRHGRHA
ncbi:MAG: HPr kinase/phosphorylase [Paracoccaceae bacterium]